MAYRVLDPKGVRYSDDYGVQVIACGAELPQSIIDRGLITLECVQGMIKDGRVQKGTEKFIPEKPAEAPAKPKKDRTVKDKKDKGGKVK